MKSSILLIIFLVLPAFPLHAQCCKTTGGSAHVASDSKPPANQSATLTDDGKQTIRVVIDKGYHPSRITLKKGVPAVLVFDLRERGCTDVVCIPELDIRQKLSRDKPTELRFTPRATGTFTFSCPMEMITGTMEVVP